jgi:hypothetical protein
MMSCGGDVEEGLAIGFDVEPHSAMMRHYFLVSQMPRDVGLLFGGGGEPFDLLSLHILINLTAQRL